MDVVCLFSIHHNFIIVSTIFSHIFGNELSKIMSWPSSSIITSTLLKFNRILLKSSIYFFNSLESPMEQVYSYFFKISLLANDFFKKRVFNLFNILIFESCSATSLSTSSPRERSTFECAFIIISLAFTLSFKVKALSPSIYIALERPWCTNNAFILIHHKLKSFNQFNFSMFILPKDTVENSS